MLHPLGSFPSCWLHSRSSRDLFKYLSDTSDLKGALRESRTLNYLAHRQFYHRHFTVRQD